MACETPPLTSACMLRTKLTLRYYLTSTTWTNVSITKAPTIEGLKTAESQLIWSDRSNATRACNFWAPEMHKVGDTWYVYFSASICDEGNWGAMLPTLRVYVLKGGKENPLSADYEMLDAIIPPNFNAGMLDAVSQGMILERLMTNDGFRPSLRLKAPSISL